MICSIMIERGEGRKMKKIVEFIKNKKSACFSVLAVAAFYVVLFAVDAKCPIKHIFGISCAGCGMTRACLSAFRLDFASAFYYHPLWPLLPVASVLLFIYWIKKKKRAFNATLMIFLTALLGVYIWRLFFLENDVVTISLESSVFYRLFAFVRLNCL